MAVTPYCTQADVEAIWSEFGVMTRLDDDADGDADTGLMTATIERATVEVNGYLLQRYAVAVVAASAWAKWATATIAAYLLATRRGNPAPERLIEERQALIDKLKAIRRGLEHLTADTGLATPTHETAPIVSNLTVDGRFRRAKVRRTPSTSTGSRPPGEVKSFDAWDGYDPIG